MEFRGLDTVDSTDVTARISFEVGESFSQRKLSQSVRDLYSLRVFSMIKVEVIPVTPGQVRVLWEFSERPRCVAVSFEGYKHLGEADLREKITLRAGKLVDRRGLQRDLEAIQAAYEEDGYPQSKVRTQLEDRDEGVAVVFRIEEGKRAKVREVSFEGNQSIPGDELRGKLNLKKKSLFRKGRYSKEKLEEDKQRIVDHYRNKGFKDAEVPGADIVFKKDGEDLEITFKVLEGPLYRFGEPSWQGATVFTEEQLQRVTRV
jgi:outer membrane protein insertion porin family